MLDVPGSIKIGNLIYRLDWLSSSEAEQHYGKSNRAKQYVYIDPHGSLEQKEETLLHEILHQVLCEYGYFAESDNEKLVKSLAVGLYQTLRDNALLKTPLLRVMAEAS